MNTLLLLGLLIGAGGPFDAPPSSNDCIGGPLTLEWRDLISMGQTGDRLMRPGCQVRLDSSGRFGAGAAHRPLVAGRLKLGSFYVGDNEIGYGLDMQWGPETAFHGSLDGYRGLDPGREEIRLVPNLYLPEPWMQAIDTATYPALLVGGAAIGTYIILEMLKH